MGFPTDGLERRVTEFQLAVADDGTVSGAVGLEVSGRQGRLHGEAFLDFARADDLRAEFWHRLKLVGANFGVARYWTEESAPFWRQQGFDAADDAAMKKLPAGWGRADARWQTLQVWDEDAVEKTLAREMAQFKADERVHVEKVHRRGRMLKFAVTMLAIILAIFVCIFTLRMLQSHMESLQH